MGNIHIDMGAHKETLLDVNLAGLAMGLVGEIGCQRGDDCLTAMPPYSDIASTQAIGMIPVTESASRTIGLESAFSARWTTEFFSSRDRSWNPGVS